MDWLTVLWLVIIVVMVIFMFLINRYFRKRKNNRRFELGNDLPIGNFTDKLSSENSLKPKFGGGSGGGAGTTRNFTTSTAESAGVTDGRIITAHSIVNAEFTGDIVSDGINGNLLSSTDTVASIVEQNATIDTAANLLSTTVDSEGVVSAAVEFMSGAAGNAIEVAGEVVGSAAEVAGEIISEIISSN